MTYNEVKEQFMEDVKRELYEKKGMEVEISNNILLTLHKKKKQNGHVL